MNVELVLIDDLELDPNNARRHSKKNLDAIAGSLREFGQRKPIVVWRNRVVAGNGTLVAARSLGWREISVARCPDDWDEVRVKAFALADNRSAELAEWDEQVLTEQLKELQLAEFDVEAIGFEVTVEPEPVVEDEIPEVVDTRVQLGQVWQLGRHKLMCADATDTDAVAKLMNDSKADLVLTDPPFGNGVTGSDSYGRGQLGARQILGDADTSILNNFFDPVDLVLLDNSHCLVWIQWRTFAELQKSFSKYKLRTVVIWDKKQAGLSGGGFAEQYEMLCVFIKGNATQNAYSGNVWSISREHSKREDMEHPHKKPLEVLVKAMDLTSKRGDNVLDLFGGSGSTLIACEQTGRTCFMMELDPKYCDVIIARWEKLTGETAVLVEG